MFDLQHALAVAAGFPNDPEAQLAALLHDAIEDGACTMEDLENASIHPSVRAAVWIVTRGDDEAYFAYIRRVRDSGNEFAIALKLKDVKVNKERSRGTSRERRYQKAEDILEGRID